MRKDYLLGFYGGKSRKVEVLIRFLPPHKSYIEVFGGAASLLIYKPPSKIEVYNDRDENLVNFFRVLRDKKDLLIEKIRYTPYSRAEYNYALNLNKITDEVERARLFAVLIWQGFGLKAWRTGWSYSVDSINRVRAWDKLVDKLFVIAERFRNVQIECDDYEKIIERYDSKDALFYLDPPYIPDTRIAKKAYRMEMNNADYERLVEILLRTKGKIILSNYKHPIFDKLLENGWNMYQWSVVTSGNISLRSRRMEVIYYNFDLHNFWNLDIMNKDEKGNGKSD